MAQHNDLVLATAMACWYRQQHRNGFYQMGFEPTGTWRNNSWLIFLYVDLQVTVSENRCNFSATLYRCVYPAKQRILEWSRGESNP
jgi:hypothetical protein